MGFAPPNSAPQIKALQFFSTTMLTAAASPLELPQHRAPVPCISTAEALCNCPDIFTVFISVALTEVPAICAKSSRKGRSLMPEYETAWVLGARECSILFGWVSTVVPKQLVDTISMIAAIVGAGRNSFNYFAELETAGKCLEWVKDHLALDEIGIYLEKKNISDSRETVYKSLYDYMMHTIKEVPAGSNGVIFTPWLHGNRCPFEDSNARGMFFNIGLDTGKTELIHAVLEGICYHLRWQLEAQERKIKTSPVIRFVGGGALSPLTCQILSDILGREIETVENPQNTGAVGAALVAAQGLGIISRLEEAKRLVRVSGSFTPDMRNKAVYDKYFSVFKSLYEKNRKNFKVLNMRT